MKKEYIFFDFSGTIAKMRPGKLLVNVSLLKELSEKYCLGIVTGGRKSEVNNILKKFGVAQIFTKVITADDTRFRKPNPKIISKLKINTYIGDSKKDEEFAKNLKVPFFRINKKYNINQVIRKIK